jgi:hypothetical protein
MADNVGDVELGQHRAHVGVEQAAGDVVDDRGAGGDRRPATVAFVVSTETVAPAATRARTTGSIRRRSSAASIGFARGFVASPPTSIRSAPARSKARPWAIAAPGSRNSPPSENESGVTLSTPITSGPRGAEST